MRTSTTAIMGVINITPDSFSDGGQFLDPKRALDQAHRLLDHGADFLDIGAESTRPGADPVDQATEWHRLFPVLEQLVDQGLIEKVSLDTRHPQSMLAAAEMGVRMVNNIEGLTSPETLAALASFRGMRYIAMHLHRRPKTMQDEPLTDKSVVDKVALFFASAQASLREAGFAKEHIFLDPGIGFGKNDPANLALIEHTVNFAHEYQLCLGVSRKSFIGRLFSIEDPPQRDKISKSFEFCLAAMGARLIRTHDVEGLKRLLAPQA